MQPGYGGMQGPQGGGGPIEGARGTVRNPTTTLLISMFCCFYYGLFQCMKTEEELNRVVGKQAGGSILWLLFPLIPALAMPKLIAEARQKVGAPTQGEGSLIMYILVPYYALLKDANEVFTGQAQLSDSSTRGRIPVEAVEGSGMRAFGRRARNVLAVFVLGGALFFAGLVQCPFAFFLHVPCPGCGLTRATTRLLHGDVAGALAFHPLVLVALPVLAGFFGTNIVMYLATGRWGWVDRKMGRGVTWAAGAMIALLVAVWIARFFGAFGGPVSVD